MTENRSRGRLAGLLGLVALSACPVVLAGAYIFAGSNGNSPDIIAHPPGYDGTGGTVRVKVCIQPGTPNASAIETSIANSVNTFNRFEPRQPNLVYSTDNNVPSGDLDFESVALHEIGHCVGLAHPNLGFREGVVEQFDGNTNYTASSEGADGAFDLNDGIDNVIGSADDARGDDVNLHWFFIDENDPFVRSTVVVDESTYTRDTVELPFRDNYVANAGLAVSQELGYGNTEAVMQQGTRRDEAQRDLAIDDVVTLEFARAGVDEQAGTSDDYEVVLEYGGISSDTDCNITIAFDAAETEFAVCEIPGGSVISNGNFRADYVHAEMNNPRIWFNPNSDWFFNDVSNTQSYTVEILLEGDGDGTVTGDQSQIDCFSSITADCEGTYPNRTELTLSASPDPDSLFTGWGGDCSGDAETLLLSVESNRVCSAFFTRLGEIALSRSLVGVDEPDGRATIDVSLSNTPTADVTINLTSNKPDECVASPSQLVIPAGQQTGEFDVVAVADDTVDGQQACTILETTSVSDDPVFNDRPVEQVNVNVRDINVALTITRDGSGSGTVSDDLGQMQCQASACEGVYEEGDAVTLSAQPSAGSLFTGWSGSSSACSGSGPIELTLTASRSCTATFERAGEITVTPTELSMEERDGVQQVGVTLSQNASEDVQIALSSDRPGECRPEPTNLTIPAGESSGAFDVVAVADGAIDGEQSCTIQAANSVSDDPIFNNLPVASVLATVIDSNVALGIVRDGAGSGRVVDQRGEIDCGSDCEGIYVSGDSVTLTAGPDAGSAFARWSGDTGCDGPNPLTLTVNDSQSCTATFVLLNGLSLSPTSVNVREPDERDPITITLDATPTADVSIALGSSDSSACVPAPDTLVIASGATQGSFEVVAVDNAVEEPARSCSIITGATSSADPAFNGIAVPDVSVSVLDNDDPDYIFSDRFER